MIYQSTVNFNIKTDSLNAVIVGIAKDGGLYVPTNLKDIKFDRKCTQYKDTLQIASAVLSALLPDFDNMEELVKQAYTGKFETEELTPLVKVGDSYVLELFRGPTCAFKDVALSMLPQLINKAKKQLGINTETIILTATSGDTGKAALEGFKDVDGIKIIVFYPQDGVSTVQKAQMATQQGKNVKVVAVKGNFDDAQTGVKNIFAACEKDNLLPENVQLSSANSINIGRLAPQVVYYFKAYNTLMEKGELKDGALVDFVVPTGNFGNILAGYIAKELGLPIGKLICASNSNNVLTDFLTTGTYNRNREFYKTVSPSMDILVSSNLERLLYFATNGDTAAVSEYMQSLKKDGVYTIDKQTLENIQKTFACGFSDDQDTLKTVNRIYKQYGYLCDTHTAVAFSAMENYKKLNKNSNPTVVLATASPFKFPEAVLTALNVEKAENEFDNIEKLADFTKLPVPKNLKDLKHKEIIHHTVITKEDMLDFVTNSAKEEIWSK